MYGKAYNLNDYRFDLLKTTRFGIRFKEVIFCKKISHQVVAMEKGQQMTW